MKNKLAHLWPVTTGLAVAEALVLSGEVAKPHTDKEGVFGSPDHGERSVGIGYRSFGSDIAVNYTDTSPSADGNDSLVRLSVGKSF